MMLSQSNDLQDDLNAFLKSIPSDSYVTIKFSISEDTLSESCCIGSSEKALVFDIRTVENELETPLSDDANIPESYFSLRAAYIQYKISRLSETIENIGDQDPELSVFLQEQINKLNAISIKSPRFCLDIKDVHDQIEKHLQSRRSETRSQESSLTHAESLHVEKLKKEADSVLTNILALKLDSLVSIHDITNHELIETVVHDRWNPEYSSEIFSQAIAYALTEGSDTEGTAFYTNSFSVKDFCDKLFSRNNKVSFEHPSCSTQHKKWIQKMAEYLGEPKDITLKELKNKYLRYRVEHEKPSEMMSDGDFHLDTNVIRKECEERAEKYLNVMHKEWKTHQFESSLSYPFLKTIDDSIQVFLQEASHCSWELATQNDKASQEYDNHIVHLLQQMLDYRYTLMTSAIEKYLRKKAYEQKIPESDIADYIKTHEKQYIVPFKAKTGMLMHYDIAGLVCKDRIQVQSNHSHSTLMFHPAQVTIKSSLSRVWAQINLAIRKLIKSYESNKAKKKGQLTEKSLLKSELPHVATEQTERKTFQRR